MASSGYADRSLWQESRSLLDNADHKQAAVLINHYFSEPQSEEHLEADKLYKYCSKKFPNSISVKLCKLYLCSEFDPQTRTQSITLLLDFLNNFNRNDKFSLPNTLHPLKPHVISCLRLQETPETDFEILSDIVSALSVRVFDSDKGKWDELRDYIAATIDSDFRKAFRLFHKLPSILDDEFLMVLLGKLFSAIVEKLNLSHGDFEDWELAFKAGFTFGVHMTESPRNDLSKNMLYELTRSAIEIVKEGKEGVLKRTLEDLGKLVKEEADRYYPKELEFVSELLRMIEEIQGMEKDLKIVVWKIFQVLPKKKTV